MSSVYPSPPAHPSNANGTPSEDAQRPLDLTTLVNKVREKQKNDPEALQTPTSEQPPSSTTPVKQDEPEPEPHGHREHWYHSVIPGIFRRGASESNDGIESPPEAPTPPPAPAPASPPKGTLDHVADAFASSSRSKDLETIKYSVGSLAVTSAAAPRLFLMTDDKGRRAPPILFQLLKLAIVDSEVVPEVSRQIVFRIELQYGDVKWVVSRTLYEFWKLHITMTSKHGHIPRFPNQMSWGLSMVKAGLGMHVEDDTDPHDHENNLARRKALQNYLLEVLNELNGTVAYELYEFLEISALSLTKDMGWKGKEGYLEIKSVDASKSICGIPIGFSDYDKCWTIMRDSYIAFCPDISSDECKDVFIFDQKFYVDHKEHALGYDMHHIEIGNNHRKVELKGEHNREMLEWMSYFKKMQSSSPWVREHRFGSFAPERADAKVRYYVDGKDYFHAVSDAILAAKDEIYIADWWLSPEMYLRRPPEKNQEFRLDRLLERKAREGIKIYIVVYKEVSLALTLDSAHTKTWLQSLHPNIQVQRHPDHISVTATQFWAHHEKICVVDCRLAFIGGLDMCFGRYDSRTHQLADYHPSGSGTIWPGQDYSNPRIKDFMNVKDYDTDLISRKLLGRMPWHDVSIGVAGQPARDIARHFVQRWNFVKREKGMKKSGMKFLTPKGEFVSTRNETGWTGTQKVQILRSSTTWSQGVDLEHSIQTAYIASIEKAEHFIYIENQFFVTLAEKDGNPDLKNEIGIALVNRILKAHDKGQKFRVIVVMPLMPAFEADIMSSEAGTLRKVMHFQYVSICRGGNSIMERLEARGINPDQYIGFYGLRSFDRIKHGKFDAIVEAVKEAERGRARQNEDQSAPTQVQAPCEEPHTEPRTEPRIDGCTDACRDGCVGVRPVPEEDFEDACCRNATDIKTSHNSRAIKTSHLGGHIKTPHLGGDVKTSQVGGDISRSRSLAAKYLLDPIPCDQEAENMKAISEKRKILDMKKRWDDSITKRAMSRPKRELGYVPAATGRRLRNSKVSREICRDTDEAERAAKEDHYRGGTTEPSEPHVIEGLGTEARNVINTLKGTKENGDLEPKHHKITRNPLIHKNQSSHVDSDQDVHKLAINHEDGVCDREAAEAIVEPSPDGVEAGSEADNAFDVDSVDDFITEQLYIHSKLMIVDDRIIIIGSANINDRSQVGYRDSEIAMIVEDTDMVASKMNGEDYQAGRIAYNLRTDLFKEHLGLLPHVEHDVVTRASLLPVDLDAPSNDPDQARKDLIARANGDNHVQSDATYDSHGHLQVTTPDEEDIQAFDRWQCKQAGAQGSMTADQIVMDPLHDDFYERWWKPVARKNTEIFREVFHCVPDQTVETWDDYRAFIPDTKKVMTGHVAMPDATVENVTERLQGITGHLVEFPTKFLSKENLLGSIVEEAVTPMEIFT